MAIAINYNPMSVSTNFNLARSTQDLSASLARLSSGERIQKSSDDPAGLVVANSVRYNRIGLDRAAANAEDGVSMLQTAESAMDQITQLLQRCRTLALSAANSGTQDANQLGGLQAELDNALGSITTISQQTSFNGTQLLDGSLHDATLSDAAKASYTALKLDWTALPGGVKDGSAITMHPVSGALARSQVLQNYAPGTAATTLVAPGISPPGTVTVAGPKGTGVVTIGPTTTISDVVTQVNALSSVTGAIGSYDQASGTLTVESTSYGAPLAPVNPNFTLTSTVPGFLTAAASLPPNRTMVLNYVDGSGLAQTLTLTQDPTSPGGLTFSNIGGGPVALPPYTAYAPGAFKVTLKDTSGGGGIGAQIQPAAGNLTATRVSTTALQTGALSSQRITLDVPDMRAGALGHSAGLASANYGSLADLTNNHSLVNGDSLNALKMIDAALNEVLGARGATGAVQSNTLQPAIASLQVASLNLTDFESQIRDTDMAAESSNYTRLQIMVQASTAMLAQANQVPQMVMQLLK